MRFTFRVSPLITLVLLLFAMSGCIAPMQLAVTPTKSAVLGTLLTPCAEGGGSVECLNAKQPSLRFTLTPAENIVWAKISPDGKTAVLATAPKGYETDYRGRWRGVFIAYDIPQQKELWRIQLSPTGAVLATNCYFSGNDRIVLHASTSLFAIDRNAGREVWRYPALLDKTGDSIITATHDPKSDLFIAQGFAGTHIIDGGTGKVLAKQARLGQAVSPLISGGPVTISDDGIYAYDWGLIHAHLDTKNFQWKRKFVTFGTDDHMGANIGMAILGALVGGGGGSRPPDFLVGRPTYPVLVGDQVLVGSLGVVHSIDRQKGSYQWSQDLAVPQVDQIVVKGDKVFVMAGGHYIFWQGYGNLSIAEPVRYGLYCLSLADGKPIASFNGPFNPNRVARALPALDVEKYDDDDAWEEEEDWMKESKNKSAKEAIDRAKAQQQAARQPGKIGKAPKVDNWTLTKHVGLALCDTGVLLVTADEALLLDENTGAVVTRTALKDIGANLAIATTPTTVIVRGTKGIAGISRQTGTVTWQQVILPGTELDAYLDPSHVPFVRTTPQSQWLRKNELAKFGSSVFWVVDSLGAVLVPTEGAKVAAYQIGDGKALWDAPMTSNTIIDLIEGQGTLISSEGNVVDVYRLPRSST